MEITKVSEASFQAEVLEALLPVLVYYSAPWCSPCKMLEPIVNQLAEEWKGKVRVVKVELDDNPNLVIQYQVMGAPTLLLFDQGRPVERVIGYQSRDRLVKKIETHLPG